MYNLFSIILVRYDECWELDAYDLSGNAMSWRDIVWDKCRSVVNAAWAECSVIIVAEAVAECRLTESDMHADREGKDYEKEDDSCCDNMLHAFGL